ncbi:MAG: hypothetical protein ACC707_08920 [Thiohalomonadales bacterium]
MIYSCFSAKLVPILILVTLQTACIARSAIILPSKYDREAAVDRYKACITTSTTNNFDYQRSPEEIVTSSFSMCQGQRNSMLSAYPKGWGDRMMNDIDQELYKSEITWVTNRQG